MTAPTFVAASAEVEGTTDPTFAMPAGWAVGDLLLVVFACNGDTLTRTGWSLVTSQLSIKVYGKVAESGEVGGPFTKSGSANSSGRMFAWRGVSQANATPMQSAVSGGQDVGWNTGNPWMPSITTTEADQLVVYVWGGVGTTSLGNFGTIQNGNLTSLALRAGPDSYTTGRWGLGSGIKAAAGATGLGNFSSNFTDSTAVNVFTLGFASTHAGGFIAGAMSGLDGGASGTVTLGPVPGNINGAMSGLTGTVDARPRVGYYIPRRNLVWVHGVDGVRRSAAG